MTAGAGLAVLAGSSACGLLPGSDEDPTPSAEPAQETTAPPESSPASAEAFASWVHSAELATVDPDGDALDATFGLIPGAAVRTDRYGSWMAPDVTPESPLRTEPPSAVDDATVQELLADPSDATGAATLVRLAAITALLDAQSAFEADDARAGEDAAALAEALDLQLADPSALTRVLTGAGLSGTPGMSLEESLGAQPAPYDPTRPRFHLLGHGAQIVPLTTVPDGVGMVITGVRGLFPGLRGDEPIHLEREIGFGYGQAGERVIFSLTTGTRAVVFIEDVSVLPEVEALEPDADWTPVEIPAASALVPAGSTVEDPMQFGTSFTTPAGDRGSILRQYEPLPAPYSLPRETNAARVPVQGADIAIAMAGEQAGGEWVLGVRAHRAQEFLDVRLRLAGITAEEAENLVLQLAGGLRLE